ncbi:cysteine dioxygenase family protein [Shimazuella sp. AN120528]|uniref:cysteine dioxygenase n=1 Tax=Shimazuella soli TaxID=1892854 RepID=UPI001F10AB18|nr:cysteine dioxygenase family protein [Shimazuella soli]MCH5584691.1 cysteine dioxygenase family protein [Shimazuella soli]
MDLTAQLPTWLSLITHPSPSIIKEEMRRWNITYQNVSPYITSPVPPLHYGRNVIFRTKLFEVIVLQIPPYVETPIHDHGESFCSVKVVDGVLYNRVYHIDKTSGDLEQIREERYEQNNYFVVTQDQIHSMYNPNNQPLITFHVYSPPIENNHIYSEANLEDPVIR